MHITDANRLVTYSLEIAEERGMPVVRREILRYKRGRYGSPYQFLKFEAGEGYAITNEEDFEKPMRNWSANTRRSPLIRWLSRPWGGP